MKRVAIIGLGLMGGSLGLALKRLGLAEVNAYARREETRLQALSLGAADHVFAAPAAALKGADLVVFCTPVCQIPELARTCRDSFEPDSVVTDVGSTKAHLVREMTALFKGSSIAFVGSHPMAGSEKTGMMAAKTDLYTGAVTAVTPLEETPASAVETVTSLWSGVGAKVVRIAPDSHDNLVARSSHLPHLVAALLASTAGRGLPDDLPAFCGAGFRDTTRVAAGSPEMWHDIVKTNKTAILSELHAYEAQLDRLIDAIERQDFEAVKSFLDDARSIRAKMLS